MVNVLAIIRKYIIEYFLLKKLSLKKSVIASTIKTIPTTQINIRTIKFDLVGFSNQSFLNHSKTLISFKKINNQVSQFSSNTFLSFVC